MDGWLSFLPQCCDAHQYQDLATLCATEGVCYDSLRPMGAVLWFSLPLRLGLPFEAVIYPNLLLLLLSVVLASRAALAWTVRLLPGMALADRRWHGCLLLLASALLHWPVFYSLVFSSLADAPAGLLALNGVWLLLLAQGRLMWLLVSGLCLGLAAFIRVFYLYPLLGMLGVYLLLWVCQRPRRWQSLGFLACLLPLLVQYCATWQDKGVVSYLAPDESEFWTQAHLTSRASGYDTVLPFAAYQWFSGCAVDYGGLQGAWQQRAWSGLGCIAWNRYQFYFGSYSPYTYLQPRPYFEADGNILLFREQLDKKPIWLRDRIDVIADVAMAPNGEQTADKVEAVYATEGGGGALMQGFEPMHTIPHVFSVWLWSPKPIAIDMSMVRESDGRLVAQQHVLLTPVVRRYFVAGTPLDKSVHLVRIGILAPGEALAASGAHRFGAQAGDAFYAWGAQLERSELPLVYHPDVRVDHQRYWSDVLLWLNVSAMVGVMWLLWRIRTRMTPADWTAALLPVLVFGQSMMVVPEQRFIAVLLVMMWSMVLSSLLLWYRKLVMRLERGRLR